MSDRAVAGTLVDSNVLLDILTDDSRWSSWSSDALAAAADDGPLWINPVVYAEASTRFSRIEDLESALPARDFRRAALPWEAAFLAGKAYLRYRRRGGARSSPLPDFFIGAHAAVSGLRLLSRDRGRYATYFPTVPLVTP
ncbi:MAG: type II toxin-antitoxin system VapC family toxin [Kineosporiaceae bacterium]